MKTSFALIGAVAAMAAGAGVTPFPEFSAPRAITKGPHEHLFASYYGVNAWSPDGRYVLVLETDLNGRLPEPGEKAKVGVVDLRKPGEFIPVAETVCWNFQEGTMAHWLPGEPDAFVYNDFRNGKFVAVVVNWRTKAERIVPWPVSAVSADGTKAISINYARMRLTRPDYGYAGGGQDAREGVTFPEDDGLFLVDLKTGEAKLIVSIASVRDRVPAVKAVPDKPGSPLSYFCHTVFSKDGRRVFWLSRSVDWYDKATATHPMWHTTAFTCDVDGGNVRRCFPDGWGASHFNWKDDRTMVVTVWYEKGVWSHVEFTVGEEEKVRRLAPGLLDWDGHCLYMPGGKFMASDSDQHVSTHGLHQRFISLTRLEDGAVRSLGTFGVPEPYRGEYWRCDLHGRFRPDGGQFGFNSVHEGSRQLYVMDVNPETITCEGTYGGHLQGVATDGKSIFWSFTVKLVKTDLEGRVLAAIDVPSHHGDLCVKDGTVYVAVNLGRFNYENLGVGEVWAYAADDLRKVGCWTLPECVHGLGGLTCAGDRFFAVGGLPATHESNYVYEYAPGFKFVKRHELKTGFTLMGIQTAAFEDGRFIFGIYGCAGTPAGSLECPRDLKSFVRRRGPGDVGIVKLGDDYWTGRMRFEKGRNAGCLVRSPGYPASEESAEPKRTGKGACRVFVGPRGAEGWRDSGYRLFADGYRPLCNADWSCGVFFPKAKLDEAGAVLPAVDLEGRAYSVPDLVRAVRRVAETDEAFAVHVPEAAEAVLKALRDEAGRLGVRVVE